VGLFYYFLLLGKSENGKMIVFFQMEGAIAKIAPFTKLHSN